MKNLAWRIRQGASILSEYKGTPPLTAFLKDYFKQHKKYGRRDRTEIAQVLFSYFRIGNLSKQLPLEQAMALGFYLVNDCDENDLSTINTLVEGVNLTSTSSLEERLEILHHFFEKNTDSILPRLELSKGIQYQEWELDFLSQPNTFLRILRDRDTVIEELESNEIIYTVLDDWSIAVPSNTKLDKLNSAQKGVFYIQDYSSQRVSNYMHAEPGAYWWDACAGGGGKSLLFLSKNPDTQLLASDIRKSSLSNYRQRLQHHGFGPVTTKIFNLSNRISAPAEKLLDGIILDVPCSGSGTWGRSPERALYFTDELLNSYALKQQQIVENAIEWLKPGGVLLYITCSVFTEENEHQINRLCSDRNFTLEHQQMITGFELNADHLFVARLISPND